MITPRCKKPNIAFEVELDDLRETVDNEKFKNNLTKFLSKAISNKKDIEVMDPAISVNKVKVALSIEQADCDVNLLQKIENSLLNSLITVPTQKGAYSRRIKKIKIWNL